jgi:hypothetical protein
MNNLNQSDSLRGWLAWLVLLTVLCVLWLIKPDVNVYERSMYLPLVTDRQSIGNNEVSLLRNNNYFLYNKIGYITITIPDQDDDNTKYQAIDIAKRIAAQAGAEKVLLEGMRSSFWFDSGKRVLRLQAVAMSQT